MQERCFLPGRTLQTGLLQQVFTGQAGFVLQGIQIVQQPLLILDSGDADDVAVGDGGQGGAVLGHAHQHFHAAQGVDFVKEDEVKFGAQYTVVRGLDDAVCDQIDIVGGVTFPDEDRTGGQILDFEKVGQPVRGGLEIFQDLFPALLTDGG